MSKGQNFTSTAGVAAGTSIEISGEVPRLKFDAVSPEQRVQSDDAQQLRQQLGQAAIEIGQRDEQIKEQASTIRELEEKVSHLEASQISLIGEMAARGVEASGTAPHRNGGPPTDSSEAESAAPAAEAEANAQTELDLTPDPTLSPAYQRYERILLYLLDKPDQALQQANAGGILRKALGMTMSEWNNARTSLTRWNILAVTMSGPRRVSAVKLNLEALHAAASKSFVTERVLTRLADVPEQPSCDAEDAAEPRSTAAAEPPYKMSARVQKLSQQDQETKSGGSSYRERGKAASRTRRTDPAFLARRRARRDSAKH